MSGDTAQPDERTRSNSYHFVPVGDVLRAPGAPCPLLDELDEPDEPDEPSKISETDEPDNAERNRALERALYVRFRDRMRRFETQTRDFSSAELCEVKDVDGQIYADISNKRAVDDFAKDLRMLRRSRECGACSRNNDCPGCWVPVRENVFETSERALLAQLEDLEGTILDVGCGEGRYLRVFESRARGGSVDYVGIDPDADALALLGSANPWATFHVGTIESLVEKSEVVPKKVDHILLLRSFNHLANPDDTAARLVDLLRDDGKLIVADNVAFGLVRSHEQAASCETSDARFEHYRNANAAFAHAIFSQHGLTLVARSDVGPTTSNQWHLAYVKPRKVCAS